MSLDSPNIVHEVFNNEQNENIPEMRNINKMFSGI